MNKTLSELGKFGNSDPHKIKDWIKIEKTNRGSTDSLTFDDATCKAIPSSAFVKVYYQKIGSTTDH